MRAKIFFYFRLVLALGFFIVAFQLPLQASGEEARALFAQAQAAYQEGMKQSGERKQMLMLKAANQFRSLVEEFGIENGRLFYNTGNAYYEAGEKGKAILYYRRAERLTPSFADLKSNLNLVRQELQLSEPEKKWWDDIVKSLIFWHVMLDYSSRRNVAIILFSLIWILLIGLSFNKLYVLKLALLLNLILFAAFSISFLATTYEYYFIKSGVITSDNAIARKGPGLGYERLYEQNLPAGTEFRMLKEQGDWWKVEIPNGDILWLSMNAGELI